MADIANALRSWSATAGSNQPQDATTIGSGLDDNLRQIQAVVRQFLASQGTNIASAATMDLTTMDASYASVTGNTTVTGLGTEAAGISYWLEFASTPMLVHGAGAINLPGAANITCAAGDVMRFTSEGSGVWRCTAWVTASQTGTGGFVHATSPTIASPTLTGVPVAPTATAGTSTTQVATTEFVTTISVPTIHVFTSTGSNAYAKPANVKSIVVELVGGGGAGGSANSSGGVDSSGGGGGAGGYAKKVLLAASVASSVTASVGAAGATSFFGPHCTATAGSAGTNGGASTYGAGGAGGVGSSGDVNVSGGSGDGGAGPKGGIGGGSYFGGGGSTTYASGGSNAGAYGAGGGGAGDTSGGGTSGGAGKQGIIIVTEFY